MTEAGRFTVPEAISVHISLVAARSKGWIDGSTLERGETLLAAGAAFEAAKLLLPKGCGIEIRETESRGHASVLWPNSLATPVTAENTTAALALAEAALRAHGA